MNAHAKNIAVIVAMLLVFAVIFCAAALLLSSCQPSAPAVNTNVEDSYIEVEKFVGHELSSTLAFLDELGVIYQLVETDDGESGKVLNVEFDGYEQNNLFYIKQGTTVKIYARQAPTPTGKTVYLTFDDGPTQDNTLEILKILDEYGAKATFFVLGNRVREYDDRIAAIYNGGHELACHSFTHDITPDSEGFIYSSPDALIAEIEKYEQALEDVLGKEALDKIPKMFRFPGGSSSNGRIPDDKVPEFLGAVRGKGYSVYDWTVLTNDAATESKREDESYLDFYIRSLDDSMARAEKNGLPIIVLMHDKKHTRENLTEILDYFVQKGYSFGLLSECPEYVFPS